MSRRRRGRGIHGWVVLDKPMGATSAASVARVKRAFYARKAGHSGTLDPLATGVLPIALGDATKTVSFAVEGSKAYRYTVRWGIATTTDDSQGQVTFYSDKRPSCRDIEGALSRYIGEIFQVPPQFSALKVKGQRSYKLARDGNGVDLKERRVVVNDLRLFSRPDEDSAIFEVDCGKGVYVRSLARDIGFFLGCGAHVISLRRTRVGVFEESFAVSMSELECNTSDLSSSRYLRSIETVLGEVPSLSVSVSDARKLMFGQTILVTDPTFSMFSGTARATDKGRLIALVKVEKGEARPFKVFEQLK